MNESNQNHDVKPVDDYSVGFYMLSKGQKPQLEDSDEVREGYADARDHYR